MTGGLCLQSNHPLAQFPVERDSVDKYPISPDYHYGRRVILIYMKCPRRIRCLDFSRRQGHRRASKSSDSVAGEISDNSNQCRHAIMLLSDSFVNAFFDGFYPHMAILHIPTFKLDDCDA